MTILKNKLSVVLDIGKTNVKLIFLKNKKIVKEYKTKQQNSYFKNSIKTLEANKIVNWLIKKLKKPINIPAPGDRFPAKSIQKL